MIKQDYGYQSRQQLIHKPLPVPVVDIDILAERTAYENKLHEAIKYLGDRYIHTLTIGLNRRLHNGH